jgi:hypothetical protein
MFLQILIRENCGFFLPMLAHFEKKKEFRSYKRHLEIVMKQKYQIRKTTAKNAKTLVSILSLYQKMLNHLQFSSLFFLIFRHH